MCDRVDYKSSLKVFCAFGSDNNKIENLYDLYHTIQFERVRFSTHIKLIKLIQFFKLPFMKLNYNNYNTSTSV